MEIPEGHFRHILLFYFRKEKNAAQAHRKLCGVYGDECVNANVRISLLVFVPEISMLSVGSIPTLHLKTIEQLFWPTI